MSHVLCDIKAMAVRVQRGSTPCRPAQRGGVLASASRARHAIRPAPRPIAASALSSVRSSAGGTERSPRSDGQARAAEMQTPQARPKL